MLSNIISRMQRLFSKGKITLIDETARLQVQQNEFVKGLVVSDIYAPQQYGIQTYPHVGADTIALFKGGSMENGYVIMSFDPKYKPLDIQEGDTYLYTSRNENENVSHRIWLKEQDGKILIETDQTVQVICRDLDAQVSNDASVIVGNNATIDVTNDLTASVHNNATITVDEKTTLTTDTADINVTTSATLDCPETTWTGNITLEGDLTQTGAYKLTGDITQTGDLNITGTGTATVDFVSAGKSGKGHTHTGNLGSPTSPPL